MNVSEPQGSPLSALRRSTANSSASSPSASQADQSSTAASRSRQVVACVSAGSVHRQQWAAALDQT
jgi:hypothetical protein